MRIIICRRDFLRNPEPPDGLPSYCWSISQLFEEASRDERVREFARRLWWEAYWRLMGRYHGGHPPPTVYVEYGGRLVRGGGFWEELALRDIIAEGFAWGLVPRSELHIYEEIYGRRPVAGSGGER